MNSLSTPNAKVAGWTPARATTTSNLTQRSASGLLPGPPQPQILPSALRQDSCPGHHNLKSYPALCVRTPARATTASNLTQRSASGLLPGPPQPQILPSALRQDSCPGHHNLKSYPALCVRTPARATTTSNLTQRSA